MTPLPHEPDHWEFEAIQNRYRTTHGFHLTIDQARSIYSFERLLQLPCSNQSFSIWEESDFEFSTFQEILNPEQFNIYEAQWKEQKQIHQSNLESGDTGYATQIEFSEKLLGYYQNELLPALNLHRLVIWQRIARDREKVDYLKAVYKKYLDGRKKYILVNHFRQSKTFQPNLLKLSLLQHHLDCLLPNYAVFRDDMDQPTAAIADYLKMQLEKDATLVNRDIMQILNALEEFRRTTANEILGEIPGWHTVSEWEDNGLMFMLL